METVATIFTTRLLQVKKQTKIYMTSCIFVIHSNDLEMALVSFATTASIIFFFQYTFVSIMYREEISDKAGIAASHTKDTPFIVVLVTVTVLR